MADPETIMSRPMERAIIRLRVRWSRLLTFGAPIGDVNMRFLLYPSHGGKRVYKDYHMSYGFFGTGVLVRSRIVLYLTDTNRYFRSAYFVQSWGSASILMKMPPRSEEHTSELQSHSFIS